MDRHVRTAFRAIAVLEALTWAGLLIAMSVKYVGSGDETGVHVMGPIHGGAFVAFVLVTLLTARRFRWTPWVTLVGLASSVPPFGSWVFEAWAGRSGRLDLAVPARPQDASVAR